MNIQMEHGTIGNKMIILFSIIYFFILLIYPVQTIGVTITAVAILIALASMSNNPPPIKPTMPKEDRYVWVGKGISKKLYDKNTRTYIVT